MTRSDTKLAILAAMRDGAETLCLTYEAGQPVWRLVCLDRRISARTARYIINSVGVHSCGDTLFPDAPAQTYRAR
jgi:hypothetical protein